MLILKEAICFFPNQGDVVALCQPSPYEQKSYKHNENNF